MNNFCSCQNCHTINHDAACKHDAAFLSFDIREIPSSAHNNPRSGKCQNVAYHMKKYCLHALGIKNKADDPILPVV